MAPPLEENIALVLRKIDDLSLEPFPINEPQDGEVLLEMQSVGICGSDVHYWQHGRIGHFIVESPMIIGHECAGQVIGVGEQVKNLTLGTRVAIEGGVTCAHCAQCKIGRYNLCPSIEFFATPPYDGSLCRYIVHPAELCYPLPSSLSYAEGAFCEPMSVGVMACNRADVRPGQSVAVMGAGPIGLITMLVAKAYGATTTIITDVSQSRLDTAKSLGADHCINVKGLSAEEAADQIKKQCGLVQRAFDCCGASSTMNTAVSVTQSGGRVIAIGMAEPIQSLNVIDAVIREIEVKGSFRYCHTYPTCIALLESGRINVKPLITHDIELTDKKEGSEWRINQQKLLDGFDIAKTGRDGAIKVMFHL